jgi:hypothetical protein
MAELTKQGVILDAQVHIHKDNNGKPEATVHLIMNGIKLSGKVYPSLAFDIKEKLEE